MEIIVGDRGAGKTTRALGLSAETGGIIVCLSESQCKIIKDKAMHLGLSIPDPVTYASLKSKEAHPLSPRTSTGDKHIIEDLPEFLRYSSPSIIAATVDLSSNKVTALRFPSLDEWNECKRADSDPLGTIIVTKSDEAE